MALSWLWIGCDSINPASNNDQAAPCNPFPANGAEVVADSALTIRLRWDYAGASNGTLYRVYIGLNSDSLYCVDYGLTDRCYDLDIERGRTYYWGIYASAG